MADLSITAASVALKDNAARTRLVKFGEAVTQGQAVYRKSSDGEYYKCQSDGTAEEANCAGIAIDKAGADGYGYIIEEGNVDLGATLAVGQAYCVSPAAGAICPYADLVSTNYVTLLGVATAADKLALAPLASGVQKA
ncbi:MAG: hypothetical protein IT424_06460 [Pirellulales bacterium]|nr:hypothetical protein [Pirellulales bacterium]